MNPRDSGSQASKKNKKKDVASGKRSAGRTRTNPRPARDTAKATAVATKAPAVKPTSRDGAHTGSITHQALARRAVGRGVRHGFAAATTTSAAALELERQQRTVSQAAPYPVPSTEESLAQLATNYRNVLNGQGRQPAGASSDTARNNNDDDDPTPLSEMQSRNYDGASVGPFVGGFLSRNSSLVDLAMIAPVDEELPASSSSTAAVDATQDFGFIDFPNPEVHPSNSSDAAGK